MSENEIKIREKYNSGVYDAFYQYASKTDCEDKETSGVIDPITTSSSKDKVSSEVMFALNDKPESVIPKFSSEENLRTDDTGGSFLPRVSGRAEAKKLAHSVLTSIRGQNSVTDAHLTEMQKAQLFMNRAIHECVTVESDDETLEEIMAEYILAQQDAKTHSERVAIAKKFAKDTRIKIDLPKLKLALEKYARENNLSPEIVEREMENFSKSRDFALEVALAISNDDAQKEAAIQAATEDIEPAHENLFDVVADVIPENITKTQAEKLLGAVDKFPQLQRKSLIKTLALGKYSEEFKANIMEKFTKILERTKKYTIIALERFFKSEKGQAIMSYTRRVMADLKESKVEYDESLDEVENAKEEAQEAQKESEKAIEEAKEAKKKAEAELEKIGLKDLKEDDMEKMIKKVSPRYAIELEYARAKEKKAYWNEYDANVAKEHALFASKMAREKLQFAVLRMHVLMARAQAMMSVLMRRC